MNNKHFVRSFEESDDEKENPAEESYYYEEKPAGYEFEGYKIELNQKVMLTQLTNEQSNG